MLPEILNRRSIRKYKDTMIDRQVIEEILQAGILAPSAKNRQPWRFLVVSGKSKAEMIRVMKAGLEREKKNPLLPESLRFLKGAQYTVQIMEQAPVIVCVVNVLGIDINCQVNAEERIYEICNAQSIGAAMENMTLTATEHGLGSLWICDTYFAYDELNHWINTDGKMASAKNESGGGETGVQRTTQEVLIAAMAIGYADEAPDKRPRKKLDEIVKWCE